MAPKSKTETVKIARQKAREYMDDLHSCAFCTMRALQDTFGIEDDNLLKASGAFTGGIGGMADTCGSLSAVAMLLGMVYGAGRHEGLDAMDKMAFSGHLARAYFNWFQEKRGTVNCNQLLKNLSGVDRDYSDPNNFLLAIDEGVLEKCTVVVEENVAKAAEMMWEELKKTGKKTKLKSFLPPGSRSGLSPRIEPRITKGNRDMNATDGDVMSINRAKFQQHISKIKNDRRRTG